MMMRTFGSPGGCYTKSPTIWSLYRPDVLEQACSLAGPFLTWGSKIRKLATPRKGSCHEPWSKLLISLGIQVCKECLLYVNLTYFGLLGSTGYRA